MANWKDDWYLRLAGATFRPPPLYCKRCATPMIRVERRDGYTESGVRVLIPGWTCPKNRSLFRRLISMGIPMHDEVWAEEFAGRGYWAAPTYR